MDREAGTENAEGAADDARKEVCREHGGTVPSAPTRIKDGTPALSLAVGGCSPDRDRENDHDRRRKGQDEGGRDSVGQVRNASRLGPQRALKRCAADDAGHGSRGDDHGKRRVIDHGGRDDLYPTVKFRVGARGRTGTKTVATSGHARTQVAVAATRSKTTEGPQLEKRTSTANQGSNAISGALDAASRANDEGQRSSTTEVVDLLDVFEGQKPSTKKKRRLVDGGGTACGPTATVNGRARKPRFEKTCVARPRSSAGKRHMPREPGVTSHADVSPSSPFLQDDRSACRSWWTRCSPALVVISVVSAGVFMCMSFQVLSVVRTYGGPEEEGGVQNRTYSQAADQAQRPAASTAVTTTTEDEGFQTAPDADVE